MVLHNAAAHVLLKFDGVGHSCLLGAIVTTMLTNLWGSAQCLTAHWLSVNNRLQALPCHFGLEEVPRHRLLHAGQLMRLYMQHSSGNIIKSSSLAAPAPTAAAAAALCSAVQKRAQTWTSLYFW